MIQWVPKTKSLREIMRLSFQEQDKKLEEVLQEYRIWIRRASKTNPRSFIDLYGNAVVSYSRDAVIAKYQEIVNKIPNDLLK